MGHRGQQCPLIAMYGGVQPCKRIIVVDITGVHTVRIAPCICHGADPEPLQLLSMGLYPASVLAPRTAFTFRVLNDFLLANKISGNAAESYFQRLRRLTNPAFPHNVPVSSRFPSDGLILPYTGSLPGTVACWASVAQSQVSQMERFWPRAGTS